MTFQFSVTVVLGLSAASAALTSIFHCISIFIFFRRQRLAYRGDEYSGGLVTLPVYLPFIYFLIAAFSVLALIQGLIILANPTYAQAYATIHFYALFVQSFYLILPVLLTQQSVGAVGFKKTIWTVALFCIVGFSLLAGSYFPTLNPSTFIAIQVLFVVFLCIPPSIFAIGILLKRISSRVQVHSVSNRNAVEILLFYSIAIAILTLITAVNRYQLYYPSEIAGLLPSYHTTNSVLVSINGSEFSLMIITLIHNLVFPFALHRTILADTKFWRGIGRHNERGLTSGDDGVAVHKPNIEIETISSRFQTMLADVLMVDFAYIQIKKKIGDGATSDVYSGKYKKNLIAAKISTYPDITQEILDVFKSEAKNCELLIHKNIVQFYGICVRPPQIGMIFELCQKGNLKSCIEKNPMEWNNLARIQACIDAAEAVAYMHSLNLIHRDIKAENFFVTSDNVIKLGDFGETRGQYYDRHLDGGRGSDFKEEISKRMTIVGTVSHMAPELIAASATYTIAIDIYALAITFWEIWTGKNVYENVKHFDIYNRVDNGARPDLPLDSPKAFQKVLQLAWAQNFKERLEAKTIVRRLKFIAAGIKAGTPFDEIDEDGMEVDTAAEEEEKALQRISEAKVFGARPMMAKIRRMSNIMIDMLNHGFRESESQGSKSFTDDERYSVDDMSSDVESPIHNIQSPISTDAPKLSSDLSTFSQDSAKAVYHLEVDHSERSAL